MRRAFKKVTLFLSACVAFGLLSENVSANQQGGGFPREFQRIPQNWEEFKNRKLTYLENKKRKIEAMQECLTRATDFKTYKNCLRQSGAFLEKERFIR